MKLSRARKRSDRFDEGYDHGQDTSCKDTSCKDTCCKITCFQGTCCKSCRKDFVKDPAQYLKILDDAAAKAAAAATTTNAPAATPPPAAATDAAPLP